MILFAIIFSTVSCTCGVDGQVDPLDKHEVKILFKKDGCSVYQFFARGKYRYFTNCSETISSITCGKACVRQENIKGGR